MSSTLDRSPLTSLAGIEPGRQVKLGASIEDARSFCPYYTDTAGTLATHGYRGAVDQYLDSLSRFPVTVPEGTRGIVDAVDHSTGLVTVAFVWKTPKSGKITAASVRVGAGHLVNHRGAPPMPGEPMPGKSVAPAAPSLTSAPAPMLATLTASPAPVAPVTQPAAGSLDAMLAAIVDARVGARIAALEAELASLPAGTSVHHVKIGSAEPVQLGSRPHARLLHVLARVNMTKPDGGRFNLFLTGDAGTGKSTIAANVAECMGLTFTSLNCSGGLTEGALVGRMTPNLSTGEMVYSAGPLVKAYRDGGVFLLDEMDAADENVLLALNTLIDAKEWHAPTGETIARHADFIFLAAGNTFGTGASRVYSGRNQLDGAFLNRFLTVPVDYDTELERALVASAELAERIQSARVRLRERNLRRWLTTRDLLKADALVGQLGMTVPEALREITEGWTNEDRSVAGI